MKITDTHYNLMREEIRPLIGRIPAHREYLVKEGKAKDIEKRIRWDLLHAAKLTPWICDNLYPYMNDEHIDTALRAIVKELTA